MKVRTIISAALVAVLCLSSCANNCSKSCCKQDECCCHQFAKKLPVGVQLYSVRTDLEKDFYGTLKAVREMGYAGVEFYGEYYGNTPTQIKQWCTELGLIPFSNHVPFQAMIDDVDKVIEDNLILGVQYLVFPYMDEASRPGIDPEQFKKTVAKIGEIGEKVHAAGFQLLYHNHDFEFVTLEDGTVGYDYIFSSNDRVKLQNEPDVCWVSYAGFDPAEPPEMGKQRLRLFFADPRDVFKSRMLHLPAIHGSLHRQCSCIVSPYGLVDKQGTCS